MLVKERALLRQRESLLEGTLDDAIEIMHATERDVEAKAIKKEQNLDKEVQLLAETNTALI